MNILTGERIGEFHGLKVLSNGAMTDILSLISEGGGTVTSAMLPLSISSSGVLSIDLSSYYTSNEVDTHLTGKADSFTLAAPLSISGGQISIDLSSYVTQTSLTNTLGSYATTAQLALKADSSAMTTALATKADSSAVYSKTQVDTSLAAKADSSAVYTKAQVDTSLAAKADSAALADETTAREQYESDTNIVIGTLQVVGDPQARVRLGTASAYTDLTRSATGSLVWGSHDVTLAPTLAATEAYLLTQIGGKQDTLTIGSGLSLSGNTLSATGGSALELAVNGTTQAATKLDFLANEATLSSGTLYIGNPRCTALKLFYASSADALNLSRDQAGALLWNGQPIQMQEIRPHAQFARAGGQTFGAGFTPIAWDQAPIASGISLNTSTYAFTVSRAGTYHFDVGMRLGSGADEWTGISVLNVAGTVLSKSYGTGQVTPVAPEGQTWPLLASLATDTSYYISLYRQTGLTVYSPGQPLAGYAIVATITYAS